MPVPRPLTAGPLCPACGGTGADVARTLARDRRSPSEGGYIRCRPCQGHGLDPAECFRWGDHPPLLARDGEKSYTGGTETGGCDG